MQSPLTDPASNPISNEPAKAQYHGFVSSVFTPTENLSTRPPFAITAPTMPQRARRDPTDKSIPRTMITKVIPRAINPVMEI